MLSDLFQPTEVKRTIEEINAFLSNNATSSAKILRNEVVALAKIKDKTTASIREDGLKYDQLALILITNVIGRHLSSGQYHVYRGTLSEIGNDMLRTWRVAVEALKDRGYYTTEEALEDMRWMLNEIESVG